MRGFLQRHPALSLRMANNIKRSRARLSSDDVETFFDNFEATVEGIPPENVFNYDETNLTNDQGTKKALFRRGTKYAERVMDATKSSISVEFCASAKGVLLPPYVIYQGKNCYPEWCEDGIDGSVYNSSKSGWVDMCSFTGLRKSFCHMPGGLKVRNFSLGTMCLHTFQTECWSYVQQTTLNLSSYQQTVLTNYSLWMLVFLAR